MASGDGAAAANTWPEDMYIVDGLNDYPTGHGHSSRYSPGDPWVGVLEELGDGSLPVDGVPLQEAFITQDLQYDLYQHHHDVESHSCPAEPPNGHGSADVYDDVARNYSTSIHPGVSAHTQYSEGSSSLIFPSLTSPSVPPPPLFGHLYSTPSPTDSSSPHSSTPLTPSSSFVADPPFPADSQHHHGAAYTYSESFTCSPWMEETSNGFGSAAVYDNVAWSGAGGTYTALASPYTQYPRGSFPIPYTAPTSAPLLGPFAGHVYSTPTPMDILTYEQNTLETTQHNKDNNYPPGLEMNPIGDTRTTRAPPPSLVQDYLHVEEQSLELALSHDGLFKCPHNNCSTYLKNKRTLRGHLKEVHSDPKPIERKQCPHCPKFYNRTNDLTKHLKDKHKEHGLT